MLVSVELLVAGITLSVAALVLGSAKCADIAESGTTRPR